VKLTVRFRGREITHPEMAERQIRLIVSRVADVSLIEQSPRMDGKAMTALLAPKMKTQVKRPQGEDGPGGVEARPEVLANPVIPKAPRVPSDT
jgi:translation initiation factor IF-3